jgi:LytS/YehU family sensor histidine kinase
MGFLMGFCVNLIFETLYESEFVLEKYKESVKEKQHMQEVALHHEFTNLKNQVNPHFLLIALILFRR